jgi:hypothetical protein
MKKKTVAKQIYCVEIEEEGDRYCDGPKSFGGIDVLGISLFYLFLTGLLTESFLQDLVCVYFLQCKYPVFQFVWLRKRGRCRGKRVERGLKSEHIMLHK